MYECNTLHFIHLRIQVHLLVFLKEIIHLLSALNMEHKKTKHTLKVFMYQLTHNRVALKEY
jgi:hypothetical protein